MFVKYLRLVSLFIAVAAITVGCSVSSPDQNKLSEVEELYDQEQYQNAMNVARYNLGREPGDLASITTVWKVQLIQGGKTIDYAQQFYIQAKERVLAQGEALIPYMGRTLLKDPYNTVRLFALYALAEFPDSTSTQYLARVFEPEYTMGTKPSDVTLEFLKSEAAQALAGREYDGIFDQVVELAGSDDPEIQAKAVTALGLIGKERAIPVLEEVSRETRANRATAWVAEQADSTIAKIKRGEY